MKNKYYLGAIAFLGLALTACDGYKEPNPPAQSNPQLPVLELSDINVESELASSYDLISMVETGSKINLAKVSCSVEEGDYNFNANAYISADDFATYYPVAVTNEKVDAENVWQLYISPATLSEVYHQNITLDNEAATISLRYNLTTTYTTSYGTQVAIVGGSNNIYGPYSLTITPLEVEAPSEFYLYTPGASNGWSHASSQLLESSNDVTFTGFAYLSSDGFKFTSADNWDGINYGAGAEEGTLDTDPEAGNLTVDETGLYWCDVNIEELTYSATLINSVSLIGGFNDWGGDVELTPSDDFLVWTGTLVLESDSEWKFRMNNDWTINLGGTDNNLTNGGDNLSNEAGTYTVTLDLSKLPYSCTVVAE